ncbi:MAG: sulfate adenylyltransferase subunit CysN [Candidatus Marinimicrobia bacterium]|nr:sulfate adenylyltransferase subunit CysN [Candidatus Neomarinimicrobiota bacterium]
MDTRDSMADKSLLRFTTTGSVDDGKSTLIGRLLYETNCIFEDQYAAITKTSEKKGHEKVDLSLLLDGLASEREQGITIDVAYRYFETDKRKFIISDTPGHEQYTRNMVTGASNAQLAIILIDARKGVLTQSRRHGFLISLLQIPHMIVAVNKMDLVDYDETIYNDIVREYSDFSRKLQVHDISFIPVSAVDGDNVTHRSDNMSWYDGHTLLHKLETVVVSGDKNLIDFRFPVQYVIRPHLNFRGYAGTIASGTISPGENVAVLPSGKTTRVKSIETYDGQLSEAFNGEAVILTLEDEIDISRGDMIVRSGNLPRTETEFDAIVCWMDEKLMKLKGSYTMKHTTHTVKVFISEIIYKIDVNTLHREQVDTLTLNDIARISITSAKPIFFDPYNINQVTGSFILIDSVTNQTVAAGMIRDRVRKVDDVLNVTNLSRKSTNVTWQGDIISGRKWEEFNDHKAAVIWLTGYSGSGKSTIARSLVEKLFEKNCQVMLLDGDNVRHGLCGDLGFSNTDRTENIRRVSETAKLFFQQGNIVVCTFISPFEKDRQFIRSILPDAKFFEIFIKCDLDVCKRRDPKGLYVKAESGEIAEFTGVSSPYEPPKHPEVTVETDIMTVEQCTSEILVKLENSLII